MLKFPVPDLSAQQHSEKLQQLLREEIKQKGALSFANFMQLVLYAPSLGYYSAGSQKFGMGGDFVTAPEMSPLFGYCLANHIAFVLESLPQASILEFGAGSGKLAVDILRRLEYLNKLPEYYYIIEISADLCERQKKFIKEQVPYLFHKFIWLDRLPTEPFNGVIVANEVLDAMPVHRLYYEKIWQEYFINWSAGKFIWELIPASTELNQVMQSLGIEFSEPYTTEINLNIKPWIASISDFLSAGLILIIDYGFPRHEYYHPERSMGTLMCYYRQHAHDDPLMYIGLQDITAHVDFTAVAEAAVNHNLAVAGYTSQANFLLNCGITELAASITPISWETNQGLKRLLFPSEMGELFKVIALSKDLPISLIGFDQHDRRDSL